MNIFSKDENIKKPVTVNSVRETSWRRISRDPFVDWIFMLIVAIAIVAILTIFGVSAYVDVGVAMTKTPDQGSAQLKKPIDQGSLDSFIKTMKLRAGKTASVINNTGDVHIPRDPSL
jgi:hypothetical protein